MEPESSLPCSQQPTNLSQMNQVHASRLILLAHILILFSQLRLDIPSGLFTSGFQKEFCKNSSYHPFVLHNHPTDDIC
jgi:hypothetical protein